MGSTGLVLISAGFLLTCIRGSFETQIPTHNDLYIGTSFKSPFRAEESPLPELDIWTFKGLTPALFRLFTTAEIEFKFPESPKTDRDEKNFEIYQSSNRSEILKEHNENRKFFGWFKRIAIWKSRQIHPFKKTFVGIETTETYQIRIKITNLNYYYLGLFVVGILLFTYAKQLARNAIFYYTTGTGAGFLASALILVFILHKFLPRRSVAYSVLIGGWSFSFYLLYTLYQNLYNVLVEYQKWVAVYVVTVVMGSFAVCYRLGPPKDPRSLNLSQWSLMTLGAIFILASSQVVEIGMAVVAILIVIRNIPNWFKKRMEKLWYHLRPPKRKLLSEEEYLMQGAVETQKALKELREYCRSPKCDAWKMMGRMSSPQRFASFVEGNSHLSDDEMMQYDLDASMEPNGGSGDEDVEDSDSDFESDLPGVSRMPSPSSASSSRSHLSLPRFSDSGLLFPSASTSGTSSRERFSTSSVKPSKSKTRSENEREIIARKAMRNRANLNRTVGGGRTSTTVARGSRVQKANKSFSTNGGPNHRSSRDSFADGLGSRMPDPADLTSDEDEL